jgi:glycosyltransferase involved in cell wall biosynthesis
VKVAYFGTWERGYPRNEQVISCLSAAGVEVAQIHAELSLGEHKFAPRLATTVPRLALAELRLAFTRIAADVAALLVGYPGQFDIWSAKRHGKPVVFNAMVSLYDTFVEDRQRFAAGSLAANALRELDRRAFAGADLLVADTRANAAYMADLSGAPDPAVCYVGAEERLFKAVWRRPDRFTALFVGKLIPLHGLETILAAAALAPEIPFRIVGSGQLEAVLHNHPANVEWIPWVEYEDLPGEIQSAGCALGIFGTGAKAARVIPNKAFQAIACGAPLLTSDTPAARELLSDEASALLVPAGDADALAGAIRRLAADPELASRIAAGGRAAYEGKASEAVLGERWREIIERLL